MVNVELRTRIIWGLNAAIVVLCGTGTALGIYFGVRYFDVIPASQELDSAVAAYRKAGLPWEAKDIAPQPPVTESENAVPLLLGTFKAFDKKSFDTDKAALGFELDDGKAKDVLRKLGRYDAALAIAAEAADKPRVDFHRDWDCGPELLFPELAKTKSVIQALCIRAEARAKSGDVAGATADLRVSRKLARLAGQEPTLIAMLVQIAAERIVLGAARNCASALADNEADLDLIAHSVAIDSSHPDFVGALRGEAYLNLAMCRNVDYFSRNDHADEAGQERIPLDPAKLRRIGVPEGTMERANMTRFLQIWTELKPLMDRDRNNPDQLASEMAKVIDKWQARTGISNVLMNLLFPVYADIGKAIVSLDADYQVTGAFMSALEWRLANHRDPVGIGEIPGNWFDPFTHGPLRFRAQKGSFRIYSVGPNGKDDGGITSHERPPASEKGFDIVASFPPISRKRVSQK